MPETFPDKTPVQDKPEPSKNIPQVKVSAAAPVLTHNPPADDTFTKGRFVRRLDQLEYALAIHEPDNYGRTHTAKNSARFWQGTEEQFRIEFDKK